MFDYLRLRALFRKHPSEMSAIFHVPELTHEAFTKFSEDKIYYAFSLTNDDWAEWTALREKAKTLSKLHNLSFHKYLNENWGTGLLRNLTLKELRLLCNESETTWKELDEIQKNIEIIKINYPNGLSSYQETCSNCSDRELSKNISLIAELQERYNAYVTIEEFMEDQIILGNQFSSTKVKSLSESLRSRSLKWDYVTHDKFGHLLPVTIDLNVVYRLSFSPDRINEQSPELSKVYGYIAQLNTKKTTFTDAVYEESMTVIRELYKTEGDKLFIYLNSYGNYFDLYETYDYHYKTIKSKLSEYNINYGDLDSIDWKESNYSCIVVYNLFSSDQELYEQLSDILKKTSFPPKILFLSVMHQLTPAMLTRMINNYNKLLSDKKEQDKIDGYKAFIKSEFLKVNKSPFYSYLAITNTLIGNAVHADSIKPEWLEDHRKYIFKTANDNYEYSIDYGQTYHSLPFSGNVRDLDQIVDYTYRLFVEMGVMEIFMQKGEQAIQKMIQNECLLRGY